MDVNEINSSNMTDKIVESMNGTEDEPLYTNDSMKIENEHINVDREENEELYEEYMYEGDYEEYRLYCIVQGSKYSSGFEYSSGNLKLSPN